MQTSRLLLLVLGLVACSPSEKQSAKENDFDKLNATELTAFTDFLEANDVTDIIPIEQLLLTDIDNLHRCKNASTHLIPPRKLWQNAIPTLRFIRDEIVPMIGPVTIKSGYRSDAINTCIKGAPASAHRVFAAFDLVPRSSLSRADLILRLCKLHSQTGTSHPFGLGIYAGRRFHVDTKSHRTWGTNHHSNSSPCLAVP
jgi:hypothetical protein